MEPGGPVAPEIVWVLDDAGCADGAGVLAVADRLDVGVRRVPLRWTARSLLSAGSRAGTLFGLASRLPLGVGLPTLTLSAGRRAARVAGWIKRHAGSRMGHFGPAGFLSGIVDLHVVDTDRAATGTLLPVLGDLHRLSPVALGTARAAWRDRLGHLPHPRLALLLGGGPFGAELQPAEAFRVGRSLGQAVSGVGGVVLAVAGANVGREATDALGGALHDCLHLIHAAGDPDPEAATGFLASSDVVVVAGDAPAALLQACATSVPVYVLPAGQVSPAMRRLQLRLLDARQVRELEGRIEAWNRPALDEAGRVAHAIRAACLMPQG